MLTRLNQKGVIKLLPLLIIVAAIGIISFLLISSTLPFKGSFNDLYSKPSSHAATSTYPSYPSPLRTFYVSPNGNDSNPGTQAAPWQHFAKASKTLVAGDIAIFLDGVYNEDGIIPNSAFTNSGTISNPIVLKAQNKWSIDSNGIPTGGAVINFNNTASQNPIWIMGNDNIIIQDFIFQKPQKSFTGDYNDGLLRVWHTPATCNGGCSTPIDGSENVWILGNWFRNVIEPVKTSRAPNVLFDGNRFTDSQQGIGAVMADRATIRNNEFIDMTEDSIQTKGGSTNTQIYNNLIRVTSKNNLTPYNQNVGIYVGGNGWTSFNNVAYNNVVVSEISNKLKAGIAIFGCTNCAAYNNVIIGAETGLWSDQSNFGSMGDPGNTEYQYTRNPKVLNNIVQDCKWGLVFNPTYTTQAQIDYNNFYNCTGNIPAQAHSILGNPNFINKLSDWHLQAGSAVTDLGIPTSFNGFSGSGYTNYINTAVTGYYPFNGVSIDTTRDYNGVQRVSPWDLGIYNYPQGGNPTTPPTTPMPAGSVKYGFEDGTTQGWANGGTPGAVVANSPTLAYEGTKSLSLTLSSGQTNWQSAFRAAPVDLAGGTTVTAQVYAPNQTNLQATIYYQDGIWQEAVIKTLTSGVWNKLSYTLPATIGIGSFGVRFLPTSGTTLNGTVYVDAINYGSSISSPTASPTPAATPTPSPSSSCPKGPLGDIDCNGLINLFDYNLIVTNFGKSGASIQGDLDNNNIVNIFDYNILVTNFGK